MAAVEFSPNFSDFMSLLSSSVHNRLFYSIDVLYNLEQGTFCSDGVRADIQQISIVAMKLKVNVIMNNSTGQEIELQPKE